MKSFAYSVLIASLVGCASIGSPSGPSRGAYFGSDWDGVTKAEEIKRNLTRGVGGGLSGIQYEISVYPITDALIVAEESEAGKRAMDNEVEITKRIKGKKSDFGVGCFSLMIWAPVLEEAMFKNYRVKYESQADGLIELNLRNVNGVQSVPQPSSATFPWINHTYVCAEKKLDFSKGFSFHVIPKTDWKTPAKLTWTIN